MDVKDVVGVLVEQNKSFKEMMQWSITGILGILVLFLASNFLTMRKMRKDEIEKVKAEIVQAMQATSIPDIESKLNNNLTSLVENKLSSLESQVNSFDGRMKSLDTSQKDQEKGLNNEIMRLRGDVHKLQGDLATNQKVYINAFGHYLDAGICFSKVPHSGRVSGILGSLEKTAGKMTYIQSELSRFIEFSKELDEVYQHQCEKITNILKEIKPL